MRTNGAEFVHLADAVSKVLVGLLMAAPDGDGDGDAAAEERDSASQRGDPPRLPAPGGLKDASERAKQRDNHRQAAGRPLLERVICAATALSEASPGPQGALALCSETAQLERAVAAFLIIRDSLEENRERQCEPGLATAWGRAIDEADRAARAASARLKGLLKGRAGYSRKPSQYAATRF